MPRPSNSSNFDEDIAERRVSDALATTLLLVAALCILGACIVQGYECYLYRDRASTTLIGFAKKHAEDLSAPCVTLCKQIDQTFKKADEEKPKKGHIEGGNFIIDEPYDLPEDVKAAVETLCKEYGYGYKVFAPVAKGTGTDTEAKAPAKEGDENAEAEKPAPKKGAKAEKAVKKAAPAAAKKATEDATEEPAEKAAEEPAEKAAEEPAEKAAEEPAEKAAEEPAEKAAEEPAEKAAEEPADKAAEEPAEKAAEEPTDKAAEEPAEKAAEEPAKDAAPAEDVKLEEEAK